MKLILITFSYLLILLGTVSLISPIPGAILFLSLGLSLLICSSNTAADSIRFRRCKSHRLNKLMSWMENRIGERMGSIIRQTRPVTIEGNTKYR